MARLRSIILSNIAEVEIVRLVLVRNGVWDSGN